MRLVEKWGLSPRPKRHPYTPKNAQDEDMDEVMHEVDVVFGFGEHVERFTFDILNIPMISMILGNYLFGRFHDFLQDLC